jgi:hypothetical protein
MLNFIKTEISLLEVKERCCGEREDAWHCLCCVADVKVWGK